MGNVDKIDAVITWVDGSDPYHQVKRAQFLTQKRENTLKDVAGETRFNQVGEIYYCVASILRFAPWINKIYIVTDNQNPHIDDFINKYFPDNHIPIEIIDHKVIFDGYEEFLPTFNSLSIESLLWRIPGLSERFIYFNDDFMLLRPSNINDFFIENKIVIYGQEWISIKKTRITLAMQTLARRIIGKQALLSYKRFMYNSARLLNSPQLIRLRHIPYPAFKSVFSKFYIDNPQYLILNISHRYRNKGQYNPIELHHLLALKEGQATFSSPQYYSATVSPNKFTLEELKKVLYGFKSDPNCLFFCIDSLDQSSSEYIAIVNAWAQEVLSLRIKG